MLNIIVLIIIRGTLNNHNCHIHYRSIVPGNIYKYKLFVRSTNVNIII